MRSKRNVLFSKDKSCFGVLVVVVALLFAVLQPSILDAKTFMVNSRIDLVDSNPGDGICRGVITIVNQEGQEIEIPLGCTLRAAIMEANAFPGADIIRIRPGTYRLNLSGVSKEMAGAMGDLDIKGKLNISGDSEGETIIDATALSDRIFDIHDGSVVLASNMTLMGGAVRGEPEDPRDLVVGVTPEDLAGNPALSVSSIAALSCPIIEPTDKGDGGAILNRGGVAIITNVKFEGNLAICDGGALESMNDAIMVLTDCDFEYNTAISDGGAVENDEDSIMIINNGKFEWNNAYENGGAIANEDSLMWLLESNMQYNAADVYGGAIWNGDSDVMFITNTGIKFNDALEDGGGIFNEDGFLRMNGCAIEMNSPNDVVDANIPEG